MTAPLAIDLFCGLGGWTEGLLAEGYHVIGFDIEQHQYGDERYPAQLVIQDVLTLHGSQFKDADLIVASPPCQEYSYMAMPWKLAKAKAAAIRADTTGAELERLNMLFSACFRIQREACEAAGRHIPMVVENVRGAIPWVGRSRWNFGSYHLWGDVPALMPVARAVKVEGFRFDGSKRCFQEAALVHMRDGHGHTKHLTNPAEHFDGMKNTGGSWFNRGPRGEVGSNNNPARNDPRDGTKIGGSWFHDSQSPLRRHSSNSLNRKAASARIAKIPLTLSRWIASQYKPAAAESLAA